ncbi:MAG: hypothetical protein ACI4AI_06280 [Paludibacteraceae bacterium]
MKRKNEEESSDFSIMALCITISLLVVFFMLSSCRSVQHVVLPERTEEVKASSVQHTDTIYRDRERVVFIKGDTIHITDSITIEKVRIRTRADTVLRVDSVPYPVEVKVVEYKRSGYDRFCSISFWSIVVLFILFIAYKLVGFKLRL